MKIELSTEEEEHLRKLQRNLRDSPGYAKVTCILMVVKGSEPQFVAECLGMDTATVYRYVGAYRRGGIDSVLENRCKGWWGMLDSFQIAALSNELRERVYTDAKSVRGWISEELGVEYTVEGVVDLLNRIGFTYKKTSEVPCEADAAQQEGFVSELGEIFSTMEEGSVVYYADGVHPTHNSRSTYAWIEKGKRYEQPTVSGRDRVNINGLLNARDVTDVIARECESVNAESTRELYQAALEKHPEAPVVYVVSDNARYYYNKSLREWTKGTRIRQVFLPPYSPNLNLIERLWKFMRKKVINTGFYRTKEKFREAIENFFDNIASFKNELSSLLTLNFRLCNSHSISF